MHCHRPFNSLPVLYAGCISKNLMLYKNALQTKLAFGKWSTLLILLQQLPPDQNKVKNINILKLITL